MGRPKGSKNKRSQHKWSEEEKEYLKNIVKGHTYKEITVLMNEKFEYQFTEGQIKGALNRYKLQTGLNGNFKKGSDIYVSELFCPLFGTFSMLL